MIGSFSLRPGQSAGSKMVQTVGVPRTDEGIGRALRSAFRPEPSSVDEELKRLLRCLC